MLVFPHALAFDLFTNIHTLLVYTRPGAHFLAKGNRSMQAENGSRSVPSTIFDRSHFA